MNDPQQKQPPRDDRVTRVPVAHIYFTETIDFPGMGSDFSMKSNIKCGKETANQTRYVTVDWVPSWLTFVLVFHNGQAAKERCIPMHMVKQWDREEQQR